MENGSEAGKGMRKRPHSIGPSTTKGDWRTKPRICRTCDGEFIPRFNKDATCDRCAMLRHHRARGSLLDQSASMPVEVESEKNIEYITEWFNRAEKMMMSSSAFAKAAQLSSRSEQRHLLRCAISRARWTLNALQQLESLYPEALADAGGLELLQGLAEEVTEPKTPALTLVRNPGARP